MNPFDYFDKIYCLNLPENGKRKEIVSKEFYKVGILERINWIAAPKPPDDFYIDLYRRNPSAEFGCSLSNITAVVQSIHDNDQHMLVFEDDVVFVDNSLEILSAVLQQLPSDWECFHLGCTPIKVEKYKDGLLRIRTAHGTYAYALTGAVLLEFFKYWTYGITHGLHKSYSPIDWILTMFFLQRKTRYCIAPPIVYPNDSIASTISKKTYLLTKHMEIWKKHT